LDIQLNENNLVGTKLTQLRKTSRVAAAVGVTTFTVSATAATAGDSFQVAFESIDGAPVHIGQVKRYFKRYQIATTVASANALATAVRAAINADPNSEVVASGGTDEVILTANFAGVQPQLYSTPITGANVSTTPATAGTGNYENLINEEWNVKGKDIYMNQEELPVKGTQYSQWDFTVAGTSLISGYGGQIPNQIEGQVLGTGTGQVAGVNPSGNYNFRLYVATGTTLEAALDLVDGDLGARA
jgi:hypothetical protein